MNTVIHGLWGATIGRTVGLPVEAAVMGAIPDLPIPALAYYHRKGLRGIEKQPKWIANVYKISHNLFFGLGLTLILYCLSPHYAVLGIAILWHGIEDALVHDGTLETNYATRFLYPIWKKKLKGYSATNHKWIQFVDLAVIGAINVLLF